MERSHDAASGARWLWCSARHGVISTHSQAHPGYPFGSVVPFVLGHDGHPLLLLSPLSQHTRNLDQVPQCSLTLLAEGLHDVQQRPRLTVLGDVAQVDPGDDAQRYFRFFPPASAYHAQLGFLFYRFSTHTCHWNGGFATARWLGAERLVHANPLDAATETRIIEHMNADHRSALRAYVSQAGYRSAAKDPVVEMVGIDSDGLDIRFDDALVRVPLAEPIDSPGGAREILMAMADRAFD